MVRVCMVVSRVNPTSGATRSETYASTTLAGVQNMRVGPTYILYSVVVPARTAAIESRRRLGLTPLPPVLSSGLFLGCGRLLKGAPAPK